MTHKVLCCDASSYLGPIDSVTEFSDVRVLCRAGICHLCDLSSYVTVSCMSVLVDRPPGVFEFESFSKGTKSMMDAIVAATAAGATSIIG